VGAPHAHLAAGDAGGGAGRGDAAGSHVGRSPGRGWPSGRAGRSARPPCSWARCCCRRCASSPTA
jgi:hypothetical protein